MIGKTLITGVAGFIGFHLAKKLLESGFNVFGVDNLNDYYNVNLKKDRLSQLQTYTNFNFQQIDISKKDDIKNVFKQNNFEIVVNLAAQAGVRYSLKNPYAYLDSNLSGFLNILECCRHYKITHLVFASSSSVYGANRKMPYSTKDNVDHPVSLYAATKKSNELMAHAYANLYNIPVTGLRFFTVYGAWGRPDMAYFSFTKAIFEEKPIDIYNFGDMKRDFTYIDDIVEGIINVMQKPAQPDNAWDGQNPDASISYAPYKIYNIGNNNPVQLLDFVNILENEIGKKAIKNLLPMQKGDVLETFADISDLQNEFGFKPKTSLEYGLKKFVDWYKDYYKKG